MVKSHQKYSLQKRNTLVSKSMTVALAIGVASVIGVGVKNGIPTFMEYLNKNQQNPELKQYFDGILEEHQNDRKHL